MKFLKNIFGSKQNKKSKFKSNTLAEANGSPDLRLATAKEKESDVPVLKKEEVKKTPKKATSAAARNALTAAPTAFPHPAWVRKWAPTSA